MKEIIIFILIWLLLGMIGTGIQNAYQKNEFSSIYDLEECGTSYMLGAVFGPIFSFLSFFMTGFSHNGLDWSCEI